MTIVLKLGTLPKPDLKNITLQWINISKEFDAGMISDEYSYHHIKEIATARTREFQSFIEDSYSKFTKEPHAVMDRNQGFAIPPEFLNELAKMKGKGVTASKEKEFIAAIKKIAAEVDHSKTWVFFYVERI